MKQRRTLTLALLALASALYAQTAPMTAPPPLPMRNVLIELRQDDGDSNSRERVAADVNARVQPGRTEAEVAIDARSRQSERSGRTQQQVLVLNGRPVAIALGVSVPLRLRQLVTQGGVRRSVPGTVWLQAGTGFTATPVWQGADTVYLELAATQGRQPLGPSASTTTTLLLPLDEWMTVADSDDAQDQQQNAVGLAGGGRDQNSTSRRLRVQVRVSLR
ncbi:MAG: hypothetical protein Q8R72_09110 [Hylemonella sp.]|nr:hypothetical protein [Hylemonella sp.]